MRINQRAEHGQGALGTPGRGGAMRSDSAATWQSGCSAESGACRPTAGRPGPATRINQRAERGQGASATPGRGGAMRSVSEAAW